MATTMSAADVAKKWASNLSAATATITAGVNAVQNSPTAAAAAAADRYAAGVAASVASGKFQRSLNNVSLQDWKTATLTKGISRIAGGAQAAIPKMTSFMNQWLPYLNGMQGALQQFPRGTLEQNIARMGAAVRYAAAFQRQ